MGGAPAPRSTPRGASRSEGSVEIVRWLAEAKGGDAASLGGKGANLAELIRLGMPVPDGFAITTEAYAAHAARCGLADALAPALSRGDFRAAEAAARDLLGGASVGAPLRSAVVAAYHRMGAPP